MKHSEYDYLGKVNNCRDLNDKNLLFQKISAKPEIH